MYLLFKTESPRGGIADLFGQYTSIVEATDAWRILHSAHIYNTYSMRIELFKGWPNFIEENAVILCESDANGFVYALEDALESVFKFGPDYGLVEAFTEEVRLSMEERWKHHDLWPEIETYISTAARTWLWKKCHE
jgi:hypothetical protein